MSAVRANLDQFEHRDAEAQSTEANKGSSRESVDCVCLLLVLAVSIFRLSFFFFFF